MDKRANAGKIRGMKGNTNQIGMNGRNDFMAIGRNAKDARGTSGIIGMKGKRRRSIIGT